MEAKENKYICYYFEYLDYWPHLYCYNHVSVDMSFGLLQVFHVELHTESQIEPFICVT